MHVYKIKIIESKGSEKAFRVATFVESSTGSDFTKISTADLAGSIYAPSGYAYQTEKQAISTVADGSATLGDVTIADSKSTNSIGTISDTTTGPVYYKVWVRLWLEGEDKSCYNDLFLSSGNWSLNLEVKMGTPKSETVTDGIGGVSALGVSYTAA